MTCCRGRRSGPTEGDPHGPNTLENYSIIHHKRLEDLNYFVIADDVQFDVIGDSVIIGGRLWCLHGLFVQVSKVLEFVDANLVRTKNYTYHAGVAGDQDRCVFRYDNFDQKSGHLDKHHCHRFNTETWEEILPEVPVGAELWPHLSDAVEELAEWWDVIGIHILPDVGEDLSAREIYRLESERD
jgi:hypothetical protein